MAESGIQLSGLDGVMRALQALPKEVVQKRGGPVRKVLRKAANVIRDEAKRNAQAIVSEPNKGGDNYSSGTLVKNIKTVKGRQHRTLNGERMFVLIPKRARYPITDRTPTGIPVAIIGRMLEYGYDVTKRGVTYTRKPMPWMRPAFHAKKGDAVAVIQRELPKEIEKIADKLGRLNR